MSLFQKLIDKMLRFFSTCYEVYDYTPQTIRIGPDSLRDIRAISTSSFSPELLPGPHTSSADPCSSQSRGRADHR